MTRFTKVLGWIALVLMGDLRPATGQPHDAGRSIRGLTMEQAVSLAVQRDERTRVVGLQAEAAEERLARARSFFFPELSIAGTLTRRPRQIVRELNNGNQIVIQRFNALAGTALLDIPVFDARSFPLYRQARLESEAAALGAAEQRRLIGYEAADAFLMVLGTQEVVNAAERRLAFSRDRLQDARARALAGLVSSNDVTRSELEVATAERQLVVARNGGTAARLQLSFLLVTEIEGPLVEPTRWLAIAAGTHRPQVDALVSQGQRDRLDLRAGDKQVDALNESASEPIRRALPVLSLIGQGRYSNEAGLLGRNFDGFAALNASWLMFDGGERYAEKREREALARAAALDQARRRRGVVLDVRRGLVALDNARDTLASSQVAATVAARHADETTELYRQGLTTALQVADANLRRFEADVTLVQDRYALVLAFLDVQAAIGEFAPGQDRARP